jgi:predicted Rossmann fold nucleotide-binding protein DprA/Smf involved in DNA uptake
LVALLLSQRLVEAGAPPLKAREFWSLAAAIGDMGRLLGEDASTIAAIAGVDRDAAERLVTRLAAATSFAFALDDAEQSGLSLLAGTTAAYPSILTERLGAAAPPILYALGPPELLNAAALGIVGSRSVSEAGARVARAAAEAAVAHGYGVVSGGARGVDRTAMTAALAVGGPVVGVLADSLMRHARDPADRRAITDGALCLCSPYPPRAVFSAANAIGRNKLIYALSAATLVVECQPQTGGSWAGAVEALRRRTAPVAVWTGEGATDGNRALEARGAVGVGDVGRMFPLPVVPESGVDQLGLGF